MFQPGDDVWYQATRDKRRLATVATSTKTHTEVVFDDGLVEWTVPNNTLSICIAQTDVDNGLIDYTDSGPLVLNGKHPAMFDVDDTLILWDELSYTKEKYCLGDRVVVTDPNDGAITTHPVHHRHVGFLKKQKAKGYPVVVWSASGPEWASAVVTALGLEEYVDVIMGKPSKWVDDHSDPSEILANHIFLDEKGWSL